MKNRKVILIMTDSQRWDMVGCYRNTGLLTPNIDSLAENGIRCERAYTTQPVCQAARAGIFTGKYPHSTGCWSNLEGLSDNVRTLGERLQDKGVHTAYIGKWHLDGSDYFGLGRAPAGWDSRYWFDMRNYLENMSEEDRVKSRKNGAEGVSAEFTFGHQCSDRAIDFLYNHGSEDFFLAVSYDEPHDPSLCPEPYRSMYNEFDFPKSENIYDSLENKPSHQKVWANGRNREDKSNVRLRAPRFFGCNTFIDKEIGRVVAAADKYAPDCVIIYTSDHGDMLSSHSLFGKGPAAYDEITRIPLIIRGAGIPKGVVDPNPVSHIDIAPTVMDIMGFEIPRAFDGHSLLPSMENPGKRVNDKVFIEFGRYETDHDGFGGFQPMRAVFDGRYKLVVNLLSEDELYDLDTDPAENNNLINSAELAAVRDVLHDALLENMNRTRDPFRGYYWEDRPWRKDARDPSWDYTLMTRQREEDEFYEPRQLDYATGLEMTDAVRKKNA